MVNYYLFELNVVDFDFIISGFSLMTESEILDGGLLRSKRYLDSLSAKELGVFGFN